MKSDPSYKLGRAVAALALVCAAALCASAQTAAHDEAAATPTPVASPAPSPPTDHQSKLERDFVKNVLRDQRAIWTSPFRLGRGDARWLAPLGLSVAALVATDRHTAGAIDNDDHLAFSRHFSDAGSIYGAGGAAAIFYLVGRSSHNARARETGVLGGEAILDGLIISNGLKLATRRSRPLEDDGEGEFFSGGSSFPSGHAITAWSLATVVAEEYQGRGVRLAAYGLASAVSLARYTGRKHFLSDVLIGSAVGYGTGRYVYHAHHDRSLDAGGDDAGAAYSPARSRLLPRVAPEYDPRARLYGVALAWSF